jgi:glutamate-5-semialdehyde dehydrogenase
VNFDARAFALSSRGAARVLVSATTQKKDDALAAMASALRRHSARIASENALDVADAKTAGKNDAFIDRLVLDEKRIEAMAAAVDAVRALPDPIGEVTERWTRPNGLRVRKERLPLGVVLMIYESRPNVTSDAAALCLKSGNAAILRGGSESFRSNRAIESALQEGLGQVGLPRESIQLVPTTDRESMLELLKLDGIIDLCIPRGGEGLIRFVVENARVPVVKHYQGVCHVYVEKTADLDIAERIIVNAKASRPGVCNAAECLLVDASIAADFLPRAAKALTAKGVELRAEERAMKFIEATPAKSDDFGREFLELILAVKVVDGFEDALAHIAKFGSEHTEAIVTRDDALAKRFTREVTASAVMVNASTRFNDGGELGLGAEIGISTSRLHAFGAMGLKELTAQKYVVEGDGQIR